VSFLFYTLFLKYPFCVALISEIVINAFESFSETIDFLKNKIRFHATDDDLIPYYPINFDEFSINPVASVCLGPKNKVRFADIELFLKQHGYEKTVVESSKITYH
jgi:hypothetical protein